MSEPFAPPTSDQLGAQSASALPAVARGLAIVAIVLGVLGVLMLSFGILSAFGAAGMNDALVNTQPHSSRGAYRELLEAQQSWMGLGVAVNLLGVVVSGLMVAGGVRALTSGALGLLVVGTLGAVVFDILTAVFSPLLAFGLVYGEWTAYVGTLGDGPAATGAIVGAGIGIVMGSLFYLALAVFWGWATARVNSERRALSLGGAQG